MLIHCDVDSPKTKPLTLDGDLVIKLKELAEEDDRSFSQYINLVLKDHLKEKNAAR